MDREETRWIERARQGDRQAFAELVRVHQGAVRAHLRRLTGGQSALADDLAQETFLSAWLGLPRYRADARFSTWLYCIAYNAYRMHQRSAAASPAEDLGDLAEDAARTLAAPAALDPAAQGELQRALSLLSSQERAAILHCYYLGMSHEEAAMVLGWPLGTLKSHVRRGLAGLRDRLGVSETTSESHEPIASAIPL